MHLEGRRFESFSRRYFSPSSEITPILKSSSIMTKKELEAKIQELQNKNQELEAALRWYVENDEVNEGGQWEVENAFWLAGKRRAMKILGMETEE